jgi:hypothetical protein
MWEAVAKIVSYIMSWFTPERQTQRLKDELWRLRADEQRMKLEKWSVKNEKKFNAIKSRIAVIERMLNNRAS